MRERQYDFILESPMGTKNGTLRMRFQRGAVTGTLSLLGFDNEVAGALSGPGEIRLTHPLRSAVSTFQCESVLSLTGDGLSGRVCTDWGCWLCRGTLTAANE
ncbi:hypothetical protein [uncultured Oscillibacter sp.]|uniref:hypothetical protein n=1 Tax=uncultured Oscillibacter sp. TaxID=876091 RepID=UPI0025D7C099|nr:hypothetical protein [uncultured Oscillibacter sp.]